MAPGVATLERWTRGVPGVPPILEFIGLDGHFENVGFHLTPVRPFLDARKTYMDYLMGPGQLRLHSQKA